MRALHVWRARLDAGEWPSAAEWADAGPDHAAAVAVAGEQMPPIEQFEAKPRASAQ